MNSKNLWATCAGFQPRIGRFLIGLAALLGYRFPENFDQPYRSLSVRENLFLPPVLREGGLSDEALYATFPNLKARAGKPAQELPRSLPDLNDALVVGQPVLRRSVDPGQTVATNFQAPVLFTLAEDLKQMEIQVDIDEADVGKVQEGQKATFTVDAYPERKFSAEIREVRFGSDGEIQYRGPNVFKGYWNDPEATARTLADGRQRHDCADADRSGGCPPTRRRVGRRRPGRSGVVRGPYGCIARLPRPSRR